MKINSIHAIKVLIGSFILLESTQNQNLGLRSLHMIHKGPKTSKTRSVFTFFDIQTHFHP